jgi:hypothetical protein
MPVKFYLTLRRYVGEGDDRGSFNIIAVAYHSSGGTAFPCTFFFKFQYPCCLMLCII